MVWDSDRKMSSSLRWLLGGRRRGGASREKGSSESTGGGGGDEEFGVSPQLLDFVKAFTVDTFKDSPLLQDAPAAADGEAKANVRKDLTEWQARHATLVLSKAKEISQLRYTLCPRHLKEEQFWRIYFLLVKGYVAPYEMRAVQKAKIKLIGLENDKSSEKDVIEVEMIETQQSNGSSCMMERVP